MSTSYNLFREKTILIITCPIFNIFHCCKLFWTHVLKPVSCKSISIRLSNFSFSLTQLIFSSSFIVKFLLRGLFLEFCENTFFFKHALEFQSGIRFCFCKMGSEKCLTPYIHCTAYIHCTVFSTKLEIERRLKVVWLVSFQWLNKIMKIVYIVLHQFCQNIKKQWRPFSFFTLHV